MFQLKSINQLICSQEELKDFYDCTLSIWAQEDGRTMTFENFAAVSKDIKRDTYIFDCYLLMKNEAAIGKLIFQTVQEHDDQDVTISIIEQFIDDEVFSFLDKEITNSFFERKSWLKTFQPKIREWAKGKGFKVANHFQYFEKQISCNQISELEAKGTFPSELTLHHVLYPEGEFMEEYIAFMNTCFKEMIRENVRENLEMKKDHLTKWIESCKRQQTRFKVIVLRNSDKKMVAMSFGLLTEPNPKIFRQHMTGVDKNYRGKGIGMAMKSLLYAQVLREYPSVRTVTTDCFTSNKPMFDIQLKMGFQPTKLSDELVRELQ